MSENIRQLGRIADLKSSHERSKTSNSIFKSLVQPYLALACGFKATINFVFCNILK